MQLEQFNILLKLLLPMIIGLLLIFMISIVSDFIGLEKNIKYEAKKYFNNTSVTLDYILKKDTDLMKTLIDQISKNNDILKLYEQNKKDELFKSLSVLFRHYNINHHICLFYLHKKDQHGYMKLHKENAYSNLVSKKTLKKSKKMMKTISGIEFGLANNLTLRVVSPVIKNGKFLLFIELGKNIDKIIEEYTNITKSDIIFTVNKNDIDSNKFEEWKCHENENKKFEILNDSMNKYYVTNSTIKKIGKELQEELNSDEGSINELISNNGREYYINSETYYDINKNKIGRLFVLKDVTESYKNLYKSVFQTSIIILVILCITIWYYFKHLRRTESELNAAYKSIQKLSVRDGLTQLYNKEYYLSNVSKLIHNCSRFNSYITFILMDVDNFKKYNDNYGHLKGDHVLIDVAKVVKNTFKRDTEFCFRVGGEEFLIVSASSDKNNGHKMANKLCKQIKKKGIPHDYNEDFGVITASIGTITKHISHDIDIEDLYDKADKALYQSKQNGRNQVTIYEKKTIKS